MEERLPMLTTAPGLARHAAQAMLCNVLPTERLDDLMIAVSEVVTNAVRHSGMRPDETIDMRVDYDGARVHVEVEDSGSGFARPDGIEARPSLIEGGQGLRLVQEMADGWGVDVGACTRVWFDMPVA
jgi:anti-sigma regulatory factor (Ser/Thr protein kinase)